MPRLYLVILSIITLVLLLSFGITRHFEIPKVWDVEKIHSMHLPMPDTSIHINPVSEEYYYQLPERVAYKSYPFYMPGREPKGYFDWLRQQQPEIIFNADNIKSEADWIRAG